MNCLNAFYWCKALTSIELSATLTTIGEGAFLGSGLTTVTFAEGINLTTTGSYAFEGCSSLTSIVLPSSVTYIGSYAFYYCSSLTSINFNGTMAEWKAISKGYSWNSYMPSDYKVYCTDGTLDINDNQVA